MSKVDRLAYLLSSDEFYTKGIEVEKLKCLLESQLTKKVEGKFLYA